MTDSILVLGAAGFIGRHLVEALAESGESVIAATTRPTTYRRTSVHNVVAAFDDPADFAPLLARSRAVIHAASSSTPGSSANEPLEEWKNIRTALTLLTALQNNPRCSLLYLSSGGTLYGDRSGEKVAENTPLLPRSYHGAAKASIEHFINAWAEQHGGTATILRPSNVYGPQQPPRRGFGIIPAAFECARDGIPLTLWGDGHSVRNYIYIEDFVRLCLAVLSQPPPRRVEIYNGASGESVSVLELLGLIRHATGLPLTWRHKPARATDVQHIVPDGTAAMIRYHWRAQVPLTEGLRDTWSWFLQHC